jgi:hypothetical protein
MLQKVSVREVECRPPALMPSRGLSALMSSASLLPWSVKGARLLFWKVV